MDHAEKLDAFVGYLGTRGLKFTKQRRAIAEAFFAGGRHVSLIELLETSKQRHQSVGYATVYRTMKLMAESGLAREQKFQEDQSRYEPAGEHHDHLICRVCGAIFEFEDDTIERRQDIVAGGLGFRVTSHRHEIYVEPTSSPCANQKCLA